MANDRFRRFRHLERPRQPGAGDGHDPGAGPGRRFGALEERREEDGAPSPVAAGHLDRFRPAAERPLELAPSAEGELPFVRCASCRMDHNRSAAFCANCGADLRTEEQRAFNAQLAEERRAQGAVEASQAAEFERAQREAADEAARAKRGMAETLAREVGDAERRRLDAGGLGGFGSPPSGWGSGGWGDGWGDGWGWGGGRRWGRGHVWGGFGLIGWLLAMILRVLFGRRGRF